MTRIIILCLVLTTFSPVYGFLGLDKIKADLSLVKVGLAENAQQLLKADVSIGQNAKSLADLQLKVGNIETKLNAQGNAIAGVNNKVSNISSGRDTTQTQTNDTELMKYTNNIFKVIIVTLIVQMLALLKYQAAMFAKLLEAKDKWISNLLASSGEKDGKNDVWMQKYIESVSGHKTNGLTPGQVAANEILVETLKDEAKGEVK